MSKIKRLRVFAGPNGSGKSTLFEQISTNFSVGHFINSDLIEKEISEKGFIHLDRYNIKVSTQDFENFKKEAACISLLAKAISEGKTIDIDLSNNIIVDRSKETHSYEASLITAFIRKQLILQGKSYSFETVMSHVSKLDEITLARQQGYKAYLYFVCIEDPEINISRIENRVEKGGHPVQTEKVIKRYFNTLNNLLPALKLVDKAYIFDNSTEKMQLFAQSKDQSIEFVSDNIPNWFVNTLAQNS